MICARDNGPNTYSACVWTIDRTVATLGRDRPPTEIADEGVGQALAVSYGGGDSAGSPAQVGMAGVVTVHPAPSVPI